MSNSSDDSSSADGARLSWYVYDRHANLLRVAATLPEAESWAFAHWNVTEVGHREQVAEHDYYYLLLAAQDEYDFHSRDFQARIVRYDRVIALGRDVQAEPEYPSD